MYTLSKEDHVPATRSNDAIPSTSGSVEYHSDVVISTSTNTLIYDHSEVNSTSNTYHSDVSSNTSNIVQDAEDNEVVIEVMSSHEKTNTMADYADIYEDLIGDKAAVFDPPHAEIIYGENSHDDNDSLPDIREVKEQPATKEDNQDGLVEYTTFRPLNESEKSRNKKAQRPKFKKYQEDTAAVTPVCVRPFYLSTNI